MDTTPGMFMGISTWMRGRVVRTSSDGTPSTGTPSRAKSSLSTDSIPHATCSPSPSQYDVPGAVGTTFMGDESLDFVRNPVEFVQEKCRQYGPVFKLRIMNKGTVVVASNDAVKEMLEERYDCYSIGFLDHMKDIFGENILFADGDELVRLRTAIQPFFTRESVEKCMPTLKQIINNCIPKITPGSPIVLYELFKRLSTELSLALFLGMDLEEIESLVDHVIELGKSHWHGFVSVPLKFVPSFLGSGYAQSIDAKTELLKFIHDRIEAGKLKISGSDDFSGFQDIDEAARHVLVFISALIPKAFGSLLTSFCLETAARRDILQKCVDDDSFLDDTLLEVSRLWPPFLGSRRITKQEHAIQGHTIPKGMPVLYITHAANHDPTVFASPDEFIPQRWAEDNRNDRDRVFTLGSGGRECIGKVLAQLLFKECARSLAEHWTWELPDGQSLQYKWLPVSRPSTDVVALFTPR
ncbi:cytochrome P450 26A1-like isoform X1 [Sycon ciliatum]|uniref:cytochrome P450 26A1-like isoform X1 n=1 Tax=Sycon ciliatum TaxID=27933 RepID=UPI0020ABFA4C|eukprot:scpid44601/ scgid4568/ Putative cytochrome P450 120